MAVKITIIGWYGTETIGDRAILSGIFTFFKKAFGEFEVKLGSLYPFFTQRTLNEDHNFWKGSCNCIFPVQIFDSKKVQELDKILEILGETLKEYAGDAGDFSEEMKAALAEMEAS